MKRERGEGEIKTERSKKVGKLKLDRISFGGKGQKLLLIDEM